MKIQMCCLFCGAVETGCIQLVIIRGLYTSHINKDTAKEVEVKTLFELDSSIYCALYKTQESQQIQIT